MENTPEAAALAVIDLARQGRFAEITEMFAPQLQPMAPPEALRAAWESQVAKTGPVAEVGSPVCDEASPGTVLVKIPLGFTDGAATAAVTVAGERWIVGVQFLPPQAAEPLAPWVP